MTEAELNHFDSIVGKQAKVAELQAHHHKKCTADAREIVKLEAKLRRYREVVEDEKGQYTENLYEENGYDVCGRILATFDAIDAGPK